MGCQVGLALRPRRIFNLTVQILLSLMDHFLSVRLLGWVPFGIFEKKKKKLEFDPLERVDLGPQVSRDYSMLFVDFTLPSFDWPGNRLYVRLVMVEWGNIFAFCRCTNQTTTGASLRWDLLIVNEPSMS